MKLALGALLFVAPVVTWADSLRPSLNEVSSYLASNSVLPITQQADMQLSRNILNAQADPACTYCGAESLQLSMESVVRAISLYCCWDGSPSTISSEALEPLVWLQSRIAINPDATVSLNPSVINFGEVPVATPEPSVWIMCLAALAAFSSLTKLPNTVAHRGTTA